MVHSELLFPIFIHHKDGASVLLDGLSGGQRLPYTTAADCDHRKAQSDQHWFLWLVAPACWCSKRRANREHQRQRGRVTPFTRSWQCWALFITSHLAKRAILGQGFAVALQSSCSGISAAHKNEAISVVPVRAGIAGMILWKGTWGWKNGEEDYIPNFCYMLLSIACSCWTKPVLSSLGLIPAPFTLQFECAVGFFFNWLCTFWCFLAHL